MVVLRLSLQMAIVPFEASDLASEMLGKGALNWLFTQVVRNTAVLQNSISIYMC